MEIPSFYSPLEFVHLFVSVYNTTRKSLNRFQGAFGTSTLSTRKVNQRACLFGIWRKLQQFFVNQQTFKSLNSLKVVWLLTGTPNKD